MASNIEFLRALVEQHDCAILELKIVSDNGEDLVQYLIQIERREDCLAGIVQNSDLLHRFEHESVSREINTKSTEWLPAGKKAAVGEKAQPGKTVLGNRIVQRKCL